MESQTKIKTKIVCTIGPSTWDPEIIKKLVKLGMRVARINASFADADEIIRVTNLIRSITNDVAIMLDLKGHKLRISDFPNPIEVKEGDLFILDTQPNNEHVYINYDKLHEDLPIGSKILIDDGKIQLKVTDIKNTKIYTTVLNNGIIKRLKTVNIPGVYLNFDPLTEKDKKDIDAGIKVGVDFIAGSFIRDINDVNAIKDKIKNTNIQIIAKIEDPLGVKNFDEILQNVYGIMIARGDLGVEIPYEEVPILQKEFITKCKNIGKPVIVATHMLESMTTNPRPTRAEVNDVANAIFDGADAIMTSAETSTGQYPVEAVEVMHNVALKIENYVSENTNIQNNLNLIKLANPQNDADAISRALSVAKSSIDCYKTIEASSILVFTKTGLTARLISRYNPKVPIYAFTPNLNVFKNLLLSKGIYPYHCENLPTNRDDAIKYIINLAKNNKIVSIGDRIVIVIGSYMFNQINTTVLELQTIM